MKKNTTTKKTKIKYGAAERRLKICAVAVSLLFADFIFAIQIVNSVTE